MFRFRGLLRSTLNLTEVLRFAETKHHGSNIYHSRSDAVQCEQFVERVKSVPLYSSTTLSEGGQAKDGQKQPRHQLVVVVEGLDGVGKSTTTKALAEKLQAKLICTPDPQLEPLRKLFRGLPEPVARAWYCCANYLAADDIVKSSLTQPIVIDRWWASTCSMALASSGLEKPLPSNNEVYQWPSDLPLFDAGYLLTVDEAIRVKRMQKRGDENEEEVVLRTKKELRERAIEVHRRMGLYKLVDTPTYMVAINSIFADLEQGGCGDARGLLAKAKFGAAVERSKCKPYTAAELLTAKPY